MKVSCCLAIAHNLYHPSLTLSNINNSHIVSGQNHFTLKERNSGFTLSTTFWPNHISYSAHQIKGSGSFLVGCGSWSMVRELEKELEAEMNTQEGEESGMGRYRHKFREGKGVVDMLECLEKEAIMGEDVGKDLWIITLGLTYFIQALESSKLLRNSTTKLYDFDFTLCS